MTLIIAAANNEYSALVGDRRLTLPDGKVEDEETCKLTTFACKDAKVMMAYTGVASTGNERTGDWILNLLMDASEGGVSIYEVIENLKSLANSQVADIARRIGNGFWLELVITGFYFYDNQAHPKIWRISNLYNGPEFTIYSSGLIGKDTFFELGGATGSVTEKEKREIKSLLLQRKPVHGVEMKLVNAVKKASNNKNSFGKVGKQINSCILSSSPNEPFLATYHSNISQQIMYSVNSVLSITDGRGSMMKDGTLIVGHECPPVSLPKANLSQSCPCGSGLKYKHCHAKISYPYLPLSHSCELTEGSLDSGSKFTVRTYGAYGGG